MAFWMVASEGRAPQVLGDHPPEGPVHAHMGNEAVFLNHFSPVIRRPFRFRMNLMKNVVLALCLTVSACDSMGSRQAMPPQLAEGATAFQVYESARSHAADTERRVLVHLGAPW